MAWKTFLSMGRGRAIVRMAFEFVRLAIIRRKKQNTLFIDWKGFTDNNQKV